MVACTKASPRVMTPPPATNPLSALIYNSVPWDVTENLTKVHGPHTFKAGFQGDFVRDPYTGGFGVSGNFTFSGAYDDVPETGGQNNGIGQLLLSPTPSTVLGGFNNVGGMDAMSASSFFATDATHYYYALYAMDDWKVTPKLTLNIGVRWEHATPEMDRHQRENIFEPGSSTSGPFTWLVRPCATNCHLASNHWPKKSTLPSAARL
jgi:hypothetical protein